MSKEKVLKLEKHLNSIKNRLSSGIVPERRKNQEQAYKDFLKGEIEFTESQISKLKV